MSKWRTVLAEDFCSSVRDGTHDSPKPVVQGRYLVTSRHIIGGRVELANAYQIAQNDFDAINKRSKVDKWDVLLTMIGTVGELCLVKKEPDFAIKNIGLFKSKGELEGRWLYYYLRSPQAQQLIRERSNGTTQAYISLGGLRKFPIIVPENPQEMRDISSLLSALDDNIESNRQMNETLETTARLFFKDWFIDFGPTRAKAEGLPPYLAPELWSLFPDALDDDDKPMGWEVIMAEDFCESVRDGTHDSPKPQDTGRYLINHK